jgi:hypothetical protein
MRSEKKSKNSLICIKYLNQAVPVGRFGVSRKVRKDFLD